MKILFVCTGNTCRSSMAEALFKEMLAHKGDSWRDIEVDSAGVTALKGEQASAQSVQVMKEMGIDIRHHLSKPLTQPILTETDLILTMTEGHKRAILSADPSVWKRIFTLKEYADLPGDRDIQDPYGQSMESYRLCAGEIRTALEGVLEKLEAAR